MSEAMQDLIDRIFGNPHKPPAGQIREDKQQYQNLTEEQLDKILKDSFPASDPPSY